MKNVKLINLRIIIIIIFNNRETFYSQVLMTLYGDLNLKVLITPQHPALSKFRILSVVGLEPSIMYHLLRPHFTNQVNLRITY